MRRYLLLACAMMGCTRLPAPKRAETLDHCTTVAQAGRGRAKAFFGGGIVFSALGVGALSTSTIITAVNENPTNVERGLTLGTAAVGAFFTVLARTMYKREDAASVLASEATKAIAEAGDSAIDVNRAVTRCNLAIAAWEASRSDAARISESMLEEQRGEDKQQRADLAVASKLKPAIDLIKSNPELANALEDCKLDLECLLGKLNTFRSSKPPEVKP